jgi:hypothetical protein
MHAGLRTRQGAGLAFSLEWHGASGLGQRGSKRAAFGSALRPARLRPSQASPRTSTTPATACRAWRPRSTRLARACWARARATRWPPRTWPPMCWRRAWRRPARTGPCGRCRRAAAGELRARGVGRRSECGACGVARLRRRSQLRDGVCIARVLWSGLHGTGERRRAHGRLCVWPHAVQLATSGVCTPLCNSVRRTPAPAPPLVPATAAATATRALESGAAGIVSLPRCPQCCICTHARHTACCHAVPHRAAVSMQRRPTSGPCTDPVKVAEFLLHVLRLRGRMEQEEEAEVVMEFTDSEPDE